MTLESASSRLTYCFVGKRVFFLDQCADRYFCLSQERSSSLSRRIDSDDEPAACWNDFPDILALSGQGTFPSRCSAPFAAEDVASISGSFRFTLMANLVRAYCQAKRSLKRGTFEGVLDQIRTSKAARPLHTPTDAQLAELGSALAHLRHLLPLDDRCLPISIAVAHLMIKRGWTVSLILGVKTGPFAAHAWVQSGSTIMTCPLSEAILYQPILVL